MHQGPLTCKLYRFGDPLRGVEVESRQVEVHKLLGAVEGIEPAQRAGSQVDPHLPARAGLEELLEPLVPEAPDHRANVLRYSLSSRRLRRALTVPPARPAAR